MIVSLWNINGISKNKCIIKPDKPIRNNLKPYKNGYYKLGLKNSMKLLAEKKDKQAQYILNSKEKMKITRREE